MTGHAERAVAIGREQGALLRTLRGHSRLCRTCGKMLDPAVAEATHPTCEARPDMDGPAPSGSGQAPALGSPTVSREGEPGTILDRLGDILGRYQRGLARSQQRTIGPSQIGVECDRALGYRLYQIPEARPDALAWAPLLGVWSHAGLAEAMQQENERLGRERYLIERTVEVAPELGINGSCDCYDLDTDEVIDWKLVGKWSLEQFAADGAGPLYATQAQLYGLGWERAGLTPRRVTVAFLPRASHRLADAVLWSVPYSRSDAEAALDRLVRVLGVAKLAAEGIMPWAAVAASPGKACRYCPWLNTSIPAADSRGCPGDTARTQRAAERYAEGLIA